MSDFGLTVGDLRRIAESILDQIEDRDDSEPVKTHPNTYGIGGNYISTYRGFICWGELFPDDEEGEDEDY